ncbi:MAG: hypothetical protein ACRERE_33410 [Candidatus Entotheonellia bacterium]|jgi:hypothetical protein
MKPVPKELLERIRESIPAGSEVIPLDWVYEDEDYNIAVLIDDGEEPRIIEDRLLDPIIDYDEAHGTYTICMVWPKGKKTLAGVR